MKTKGQIKGKSRIGLRFATLCIWADAPQPLRSSLGAMPPDARRINQFKGAQTRTSLTAAKRKPFLS